MRLLFTSRPGIFSWLVRTITQKPYSHVAIEFDNGNVYESVLGGARVVPYNYTYAHNYIKEKIQLNVDDLAAETRAMRKLGSHYDAPALIWFLLILLARRISIKIPRLRINPRWMLCSEYAWYILTGETETIMPHEVHERITKYG